MAKKSKPRSTSQKPKSKPKLKPKKKAVKAPAKGASVGTTGSKTAKKVRRGPGITIKPRMVKPSAKDAAKAASSTEKATPAAVGKKGRVAASSAAAEPSKTAGGKASSNVKTGAAKQPAVKGTTAKGQTLHLAKGKKGTGLSVADAASAAKPDAKGYIFINGRRIRMISTKGLTLKKSRSKSDLNAESNGELVNAKPPKTKLSRKELNEYRDLLLAKRAELVGDLRAMEAEALNSSGGNLSHMPIHMADIGTDTYDQDFMLGMAASERQRIREIDEALKRIEDGSYGVCQLTHKPIPKTRLNAKPWATHTVEAARQLEGGRSF